MESANVKLQLLDAPASGKESDAALDSAKRRIVEAVLGSTAPKGGAPEDRADDASLCTPCSLCADLSV